MKSEGLSVNRLFENNTLKGVLGTYPLTAENLFRVGLATALLLEEKKVDMSLCLYSFDFATLSVAVGFMNGGGQVVVNGYGAVCLKSRFFEGIFMLEFEGLSYEDFDMIERKLFGRSMMQKKKGEEIGRIKYQKG